MKKNYQLRSKTSIAFSLLMLVLSISLKAQLSGTVTVGATGTYSTLALAVADINLQGVNGPLFVNVDAGHTETAPTGGYVLTATGTLANPIVFQKNGVGANPLLSAYVGTATPASASQDGVFRLIGSDYITIDGIDITDPNTANPATMEFGYALYKTSLSDGAQNNTIKNCVITLNRVNNAAGTAPMVDGSTGIIVMNATSAAATTGLVPTSATGANSNNKFYSNTIQNCNIGIALIGYAAATPFTAADFGNDVGGVSALTGNTILNYGGGAATNPAAGIRTLAQYNLNVSFNTVNNNNGSGVDHATTLRGIFINTATSASALISNNIITVKSGATSSALTAIDNASGSTAASNTVAIIGNMITNCTYTTATFGVFTGINNSGTAANVLINGNSINNLLYAGTGTGVLIETGSPSFASASNNTITAINRTGASGSFRLIKMTSPAVFVGNNNLIDGVSWTNPTSTGSTDGIYSNSSAVAVTANNNIIRNISVPTSGTINGIREFGVTGAKNFIGNEIYNFTTTTGGVGGATFNGISCLTGTINISLNNIHDLNSTGTTGGTGGGVNGIQISNAGATNLVDKNKIYNLNTNSTGGPVSGILISSGTINNIENNIIGSLTAPFANLANAVIGVNITGGTSTDNVFHNTVFLNASSSGSLFGSSALFASSTPSVDLRNNILVNNSTPSGAGIVSAYRRSSTTLTTYLANSNNNLLYAGTPSANTVIYFDGTNSDQSLSAFKTRVASRDVASVTENVSFVSTVGTNTTYLHVNPITPSFAEGGASVIGTITTDIDGDARSLSTPDIGADEFAGTPIPNCSGNPTSGTVTSSSLGATCSGASVLNLVGQTTDNGIELQWQSSTDGINFTSIPSATTTSYSTPVNTVTMYYQCAVTCTISIRTATTNIFTFSVSPVQGGTTTANSATVCSGTNFTLALAGNSNSGVTYQWESSTDNVTWNSIASATLATRVQNQTAATYYRAVVTCTASATTATSTPILVNMNTMLNCYCITIPTSGGTTDIITNVSVTNSVGQNLTQASTYTAPAYFVSYNNSPALNLIQGSTTNSISITFGSDANQHSAVWIDFNLNGTYDAAENVALSSVATGGNGTVTYTFSVPATATLGVTRMRVRGASDVVYTAAGACTASTFGETEDYLVNIIVLPTTPPAPTQSTVTPTCANGTELMVAGTPPVGDTWYWQTTANGTSTTTPVSGNYTVYLNGNYYVNAYNASNNVWSASSSSIAVTNMPVAPLPPTPVVGASPACLSTILSVAAPTSTDVTYYWQGTNATGTSTLTNAANAYTATATGTYYVAAYDVVTTCWSATSGASLTIQTFVPVTPTTAISSVSVCQGSPSATINATASASGTQTISLSVATVTLPGSGTTVLTQTIVVPNGVTITSTQLVFSGVTTAGSTFPNDITAKASGAINMAATTISTVNAVVTNAGPYTLTTPNLSNTGGVLTVTLTNGWTGAATFTNVSLVYTYSQPLSISWWNTSIAGTQIATTNTLETVGTSVLPNTSAVGTYTFYAESNSGVCSSTSRLPIIVDVITPPSAPTVANSAQCGFGVPTASVSGGSVYNWYADATSTVALQSGASTTYTNAISNTTSFYVSISNGICDGPRAMITASVTLPDAISVSSTATNVCLGVSSNTITLSSVQTGTNNNNYTFTWSASPAANSGIPSPVNGSSVIITPSVAGTYVYSLTAIDGACASVSTLTISLNDIPSIVAKATPSVVCSGGNVMLDAQSINAMMGSVITGTQTTTSITGGPYRQGAGTDNKAQYLLTASELTSLGFVQGNITGLGFNVTSNGNGLMNNFTIKMGSTTASSLSATYQMAPPVVFGPISYSTTTGLNVHTFTTPFLWDGVSNVIVEVCHDVVSGGSSSTISQQTIGNKVIYSNVASACTQTTGTSGSIRAVMTLYGQVGNYVTSSMNFVWEPGTITTNTTVVNPINTGTTAVSTIYTVTVTNPNSGCTNTTTTSIIVNPLPTAPVASNGSQCGLAVPTASVSGGTNYMWYATNSSTTVLQSGATTNFTTPINSTTTWYVSEFNGTCESARTAITQSVTTPDAVMATSTASAICFGGSYDLMVVNTGTTQVYNYTWTATPSLGSGMPNAVTGATQAITPTQTGNYNYLVTAVDGLCTTTTQVSVMVNENPSIVSSASPSVSCSGDAVMLNALVGNPGLVTIGTGTTTTSTNAITPYTSNWEGSRSQYLITAAELQAANLAPGNITSLAFNVTSLGSGAFAQSNFAIKLALTSNTALVNAYGTPNGAFTTVYGPLTQPLPTLGANMYTFSTPFNWDGVSNILVDICHDNDINGTCSGCYSSNSSVATSTTSFNSVWGSYADNAQSCGVQAASTISTYNVRPNMVFGGVVAQTGNYAYQWNPGSINTNTAVVNPVNTGTASTTMVYTVAVTNTLTGCSAMATTSVIVNPYPVVMAMTSNSVICANYTTTLTAMGATSYSWMPAGGSLANASVTPSATTIYTVVGTTAGCSSTATVEVMTNPSPTITVASSATSAVCPATSVTLATTGFATTYTWNPAVSTSSMAVVTPTASTSYTVMAEDAGCITTKTIAIAVNATTLNVAASKTVICTGSTSGVTILATGSAVSYTWSPAVSTSSLVVVTPTVTTAYIITGANALGCETTKTITINVNSTPTVSINASSAAVCAGNTVTLTAMGATNYTWAPITNTTTSAIVTPTGTSTYSVIGESNGCSASAAVTVSVNALPVVNTSATPTIICNGQSSTLSATTTATSYTWSNGANTISTVVSPSTTIGYTLTVSDANNCKSSAVVSVSVSPCIGIEELAIGGVSIYPNPTTDILNIDVNSNLVDVAKVNVYDALGKLVISENLTSERTTIRTSNLDTGVYFVKIISANNNEVRVEKLIKQ